MGFFKNSNVSLAAVLLASSLLSPHLALAQTYTTCNPLQESCPPDPALGGSSTADFTSGASSDYTGTGNYLTYGSSGAQLTVSGPGDNPTLVSKWYIMFGKVDFVMKAAPGVGMVSSAILQSDDLDEIDWELLGADPTSAQTNYFGKGITGNYDRAAFVSAPTSQSDFNTYSIEWTADSITWSINGAPVRTLTASEAGDQYPQTPMQIRAGSWAGGDPSNSQGTISWAGGAIDYSAGPYSMYIQSISAMDYSTGKEYQYVGTSGSWQSIKAIGGSVNPSGSGVVAAAPPAAAPVAATSHPSDYPWVPSSTVGTAAYATATSESSTSYASLFPSSSVSPDPPSVPSGSPQPPSSHAGGSSGGSPRRKGGKKASPPIRKGVAQPTGSVPTTSPVNSPPPQYTGAAANLVGSGAATVALFTVTLLAGFLF